jgi:hypothetical protein
MSAYLDNVQHKQPSGGRSLKIADDHGAEVNVKRLYADTGKAYKGWLRRRGLMDEERQEKLERQAAKARKVKALRRACR